MLKQLTHSENNFMITNQGAYINEKPVIIHKFNSLWVFVVNNTIYCGYYVRYSTAFDISAKILPTGLSSVGFS